ncbi:MAG: ABC transporter permease, partial [Gemmatimonadetes bacterium]|nr:ABC transporter permease [Gemmatimonadota bacterium]
MNTWKTLYIKEIKDNRTLFILLPLVTVFLELVAVLSFDGRQDPSLHFLWSFVPYAFLLILPFVLSHSFAQEVKGQTHYLLLSLPVSRTQILAAKAAAVATLGIVLGALSSAGLVVVVGELHLLALEAKKTSSHALYFIPLFSDITGYTLVIIGVFYLSAMAVMLGIAGGASGLKLVVRRFAGLASTAFVLGVLYFYFSTLPDVLDLSG